MTDTPRSESELLTIFADNTSGDISPQDMRDFVVSVPALGTTDVFNVKDYGAVGDGTTDDTTAFNTTVAAVPAGGAVIYFPPGTYRGTFDAGTTKPVTIQGSGMRATILKGTATTILRIGKNGSSIRDLTVTDSNATNHASTVAVQVGDSTPDSYCVHWLLDHVEIVGCNASEADPLPTVGTGLKLLSALEGSITNCVVRYWNIGIQTAVNNVGNRSNAVSIRGGALRVNQVSIDVPSGTCNDLFVTGTVVEGGVTGIRQSDTTGQLVLNSAHLENTQGAAIGVQLDAGHLMSFGTQYANSGTDLVTSGAAYFTSHGDVISGDIQHDSTGRGSFTDSYVFGTISGSGPIGPDPTGVFPTYGASITIDPHLGSTFFINATNATAFTIQSPSNIPASEFTLRGRSIDIVVVNATAGALGTITWGSAYALAGSFHAPAAGQVRTIRFAYNSSYDQWFELYRTDEVLSVPISSPSSVLLRVGGLIQSMRSNGADAAFSGYVEGEAASRFLVDASGDMSWGSGAGSGDTTLARTGVNVLELGSNDALKTGSSVHGSLPAATGYAAGAQFYCTTDEIPLWSNGTVWKEATGATHV